MRGQLPVTAADVARIPEIVSNYDAIRTDLKGRHGEQMVAYAKRTGDGVLLYLEAVTKTRRNMGAVSMWRYPPTVDVKQVIANAVSPDHYVLDVVAAYDNDSTGGQEFNQGARESYEEGATGNKGQFDGSNPNILHQRDGARGSFNPKTLTISLLKKADLSTFLHESGHFFLEVQADIASKLQQEAELFGLDSLKPGERHILNDTDALLRRFGVESLAEWYNLDFEEKRVYHEKFARGFEAYLFEGKAPSIELQGLFQRFRAWLVSVYRELKNLNVDLTDEVRGVFDRMLATNEQITLAEQGRSMMPLFTSPEQAGMTPEEFAAYQALGVDGRCPEVC
jgi:hypothetical protein